MKTKSLLVYSKVIIALLFILFSQQGYGQVINNGTSLLNGRIKKVSSQNNSLIVAFQLQSTGKRLANATLKFTYNEEVLALAETPLAENPRDNDNKLSTDDYFFHHNLRGPQDAAPDNGYSTLAVERGLMQTGTNTDNITYQVTINNQLMDPFLKVEPSSNIPKFLSLNDSVIVLTLKFHIINSGYANLVWLNTADDFEVILLDDQNVDTEPQLNLTAENIYVQKEEDKFKMVLASTGTGTEANPIIINAKSLESFDIEAGTLGFYVYYNINNTTYDATKSIDLLNQASNFGWPLGQLTVEEIMPVYRSFTVAGSSEEHSAYYNTRIKFVSNNSGQDDDLWKTASTHNILSLVFKEVIHPTKGLVPIDIFIEPITGEQGVSTTFKDYAGLDHDVTAQQRIFSLQPTTLPVSITSFSATALGSVVRLNWATASEKDNKEFVIERSKNASQFEAIGSVNGGGTSNVPLSYVFNDDNPLAGTSYYRLKQIDFDGQFEYTKVIAITYNSMVKETLAITSVYPNPFGAQDNIKLQMELPVSAEIRINLIDLQGKVFYSKTLSGQAGKKEYTLDKFANMPAGIYLLKVVSGNQVAVQKLVKSN